MAHPPAAGSAAPGGRRWRAALPLALAAGLVASFVVALSLALLVMPPGRDQAIFALAGNVIAKGGMPYADAFDFKPPGVHLVFALAALAGGDPVRGAHVLEIVALAIATWMLYRLVAPDGRLAAGVAALHLTLAYLGTLRYWDLSQPEGFALPFILGALVRARDARGSPARALVAGALAGTAALFKYPMLFLVLLAPLLRPVRGGETSGGPPAGAGARAGALMLAWLLAGAVLPIAAAAAWLALGGALDAFVTIQTSYVPGYTRLATLAGAERFVTESFEITRRFFGERPLLLWPSVIGLVLALTTTPRRAALPAAGAVVALLGVVIQGKFFHYHWIPILPFLAWLTGLGAATARRRLRPGLARASGAALLCAAGIALVARSMNPVAGEKRPAIDHVLGRLDRAGFVASPAFGTPGRGDHALAPTLAVAQEVRRLAAPGDRLFVWGFEPLIYLESGLAPASRFIYTAPFISPWCPARWSDEIVDTLTQSPPEFLVVASQDAIPWVTGVPLDSRQALGSYPAIVELLRTRYRAVSQVERFTVFARSEAPLGEGTLPRARETR